MDDQIKTREQELLEEFKAGLDPDAAPQLAARIAQLETERDAANTDVITWGEHVETLEKQVEELKAERDDRQKTVEALSTDNDALKAKLVDAEKQVKSAKASVTRAATPATPRKLKTMDGGLSGDDLTNALAKADADEKLVEIAFSDGSKEIAGIPPIVITGEVWRDHTRGKMLRDPVKVDGPNTGGSSVAIDGYALLIDGKQVAYCQRSEPVRVNAGQTISLQDDIWF